jgi:uncharacterized protein (DUF1810 family)
MDTLERFMMAQERAYAGALEELRAGRKEGHWAGKGVRPLLELSVTKLGDFSGF